MRSGPNGRDQREKKDAGRTGALLCLPSPAVGPASLELYGVGGVGGIPVLPSDRPSRRFSYFLNPGFRGPIGANHASVARAWHRAEGSSWSATMVPTAGDLRAYRTALKIRRGRSM